jgi:nitrogen fixation protein NifQ
VHRLHRLLAHLPEEVLHPRTGDDVKTPAIDRSDEVTDLIALLLEHADIERGTRAERRRVAETVALACLGDKHLWQDMRLNSRAELSVLLGHWFPALVAKNHADMKWKKFFYKQLCEREEIFICKSPSCGVCCDYALCFGPET